MPRAYALVVFSIAMDRERTCRGQLCSGPAVCRSSAASRSAAAIPMLAMLVTRSVASDFCFGLRDGQQWRTAMINRPVFPFNTPQAFYDKLIASQPDPPYA